MSTSSDVRVRPARLSDCAAFVTLFPELAVPDPIPTEQRFAKELVPTAVVAELGARGPEPIVGYAYFQLMGRTLYVRHVITGPTARRRGVGLALMEALRAHGLANACVDWCLNVKPDNDAGLALYRRVGMSEAFASVSLAVPWTVVPESAPAHAHAVRPIDAGDDARVELAMRMIDGQLATLRAVGPDRVLLMLEEGHGEVAGAAVFHPHFPGAYPFRVARPELTLPMLAALRPYAREADLVINVVVEGQADVADALVSKGAIVTLSSVHMKGRL